MFKIQKIGYLLCAISLVMMPVQITAAADGVADRQIINDGTPKPQDGDMARRGQRAGAPVQDGDIEMAVFGPRRAVAGRAAPVPPPLVLGQAGEPAEQIGPAGAGAPVALPEPAAGAQPPLIDFAQLARERRERELAALGEEERARREALAAAQAAAAERERQEQLALEAAEQVALEAAQRAATHLAYKVDILQRTATFVRQVFPEGVLFARELPMPLSQELALFAALDGINMVRVCYATPRLVPEALAQAHMALYDLTIGIFARRDIICNQDGRLHRARLNALHGYALWQGWPWAMPEIIIAQPGPLHDEVVAQLTAQRERLEQERSGLVMGRQRDLHGALIRITQLTVEIECIDAQLAHLATDWLDEAVPGAAAGAGAGAGHGVVDDDDAAPRD